MTSGYGFGSGRLADDQTFRRGSRSRASLLTTSYAFAIDLPLAVTTNTVEPRAFTILRTRTP